MPLEIKFLVRIIPISHFKKGLHDYSGHILQSSCSDKTGEKHQHQSSLKRYRYQKHHNRSTSIQRKKRPPDKASVYRFSFFKRHVCGFKTPSEKAIKIKEKKPLNGSIGTHFSTSFLLSKYRNSHRQFPFSGFFDFPG